jgi:hypothetical protein
MTWLDLIRQGHDFGAVVHHTSAPYAGFRGTNYVAQRIARRMEQDFIAFPAYEWSLEGAHRHVVYRDTTDAIAFTDRDYLGYEFPHPRLAESVQSLLAGVRSQATGPDELPIVIAHHTMWNKDTFPDEVYDWGDDEELQCLVEIYSTHGSSERYLEAGSELPSDYLQKGKTNAQRPPDERASVQDAVAAGRRFGFIGGSDRHTYAFHLSSLSSGSYSRSGLAMVLGDPAVENKRNRIWRGLKVGRTYATTGAVAFLDLRARAGGDFAEMGESLRSAEPMQLQLLAAAAGIGRPDRACFVTLEIWKDGRELVSSRSVRDPVLERKIPVTVPADGALHPFYVRLVQDDDHVVWSSPIWLQNTAEARPAARR